MKEKVRDAIGCEPSTATVRQYAGDLKIVNYYPVWARFLGNIPAAIMLQQLLYWQSRTRNTDGWVYKTIPGFKRELTMSRYTQATAIKILIGHDLIEMRIMHRRRYFRIKWENFVRFLQNFNGAGNKLGECSR